MIEMEEDKDKDKDKGTYPSWVMGFQSQVKGHTSPNNRYFYWRMECSFPIGECPILTR